MSSWRQEQQRFRRLASSTGVLTKTRFWDSNSGDVLPWLYDISVEDAVKQALQDAEFGHVCGCASHYFGLFLCLPVGMQDPRSPS